jgi:hypothetical protein
MDSWFEVAVVATIFAVGNIVFGHFEEMTPKWRRVLKVFVVLTVTRLITTQLGHTWAWAFIGVLVLAFLVVHVWWLPRNGINGFTGEPKARYYQFRNWPLPPAD